MNDDFVDLLRQKGKDLYRDMPWRQDTRPYYVLVSELMLQQTQVGRVIPKFATFIERFPDEQTLAAANLSDVLMIWQGLGYNRRAKYLHDAAKMIVNDFNGEFPASTDTLKQLPGVGTNTAGAIMAYAYNQSVVFIETNIRTVYINHFFANESAVDDKSIVNLLTLTIDHEHPREFYWALMDYGSWLKSSGIRNVAQSKHYQKQSKLDGSIRQMRGLIVKELTAKQASRQALTVRFAADNRLLPALKGLEQDGLIVQSGDTFHLTK